ncbi:transcriptional regulator of acetoin/glycerol metabolism [Amycolatopsis echigonensis]|uniref:Transcriptional regulator of acetoin/glycerol metabolism n=1 Tax=Amycolatopsis echigonensis TaxID=2576905 RepID=A0A2N3WTR7_9PSEU|nr:helix-turn-helix domain-containing protein [Amycolatopsis niigatensis]PKV97235.1 transcriptional regulator of acetoin/glycerol metabolism [Amycolatopsis niigatensis]
MTGPAGALARAAGPVLDRVQADLRGNPVAMLLADSRARVVDIRYGERSFGREVTGLGVVPGVRLGEDDVGTNAIGTPLETRRSLLLRGPEHAMPAFHGFTCFGHPIVHPGTRRVAGVLDFAVPVNRDDRLAPPLVRHLVAEIENRLRADASEAQRRLLAAFQAAARRRDRRVLVVGHGLVLATQPALDLLDPSDHAAVQACLEDGGEDARLTLASGQAVRLSWAAVEGTEGTVVELALETDDRPRVAAPVRWPLLIVGEPGTGRTTMARQATGPATAVLDAVEIVRVGADDWAAQASGLLDGDGPPVIVENIQLLSEPLAALVAVRTRTSRRRLALTSTPGEHLASIHAPIAASCGDRRDLAPLRVRRHEIPRLAQHMLAEESRARFTPESLRLLAAQPWPGNLAELRRVVRSAAELRSAGDVVPADLPPSCRGGAALGSPFDRAEREVILSAIEAAGGNKLAAAKALGISRSTLYNRIKALRIR